MTHTPQIRVGDLLRNCEVPPAVAWIVRTLEDEGFETWTVGGSVRDAALRQPSVDWDFATAARPQQVQKVFRRTVPVGVEHGTVGVLKDGKMFEVTTFRRDIEPQGRRAIVQFADTLEEDLARRDFTINAMAWHPLRDEVKDPFDGAKDLQQGILRAVGKAEERFREDYLRILRGLRFAGRMGLEVEAKTWAAMTSSVDGLTTLSWERVHEELLKVLSSTRRASVTLALYQTSGALTAILPEFSQTVGSTADWQRTLLTVDGLGTRDPVLRAAALFAPVAHTHGVATVLAALKRIRFSKADAERIAASIAPPFKLPSAKAGPAASRHWAAATTPAYRRSRLRLALADARARRVLEGVDPRPTLEAIRSVRREIQSGRALAISDLAIDGKDVIGLGVRPGPAIGTLLDDLLVQVLDTPELNTPEALLERARAHIAQDAQ